MTELREQLVHAKAEVSRAAVRAEDAERRLRDVEASLATEQRALQVRLVFGVKSVGRMMLRWG